MLVLAFFRAGRDFIQTITETNRQMKHNQNENYS